MLLLLTLPARSLEYAVAVDVVVPVFDVVVAVVVLSV
jgi:hypothetical protein